MNEVGEAVKRIVKEIFNVDVTVEITRPDEKFGDFTTNVALQLAHSLNQNPAEIAQRLAAKISEPGYYQEVTVAGPGFINITLKNKDIALMAAGAAKLAKPFSGQEILVEFGDPNPFKEMHIGHLYSYVVGDSICRLFESAGASLKRLSYHGDVGLHVAKAIWGMQNLPGVEVANSYAVGAQAYEADDSAKKAIDDINERIYKKDDEQINQLYDQGKRASFESFDHILKFLNIKTDKRYLESQTMDIGVQFVKQNLGKVFKESQGAIIYDGEKAGLHTRVFITSKGLPTYETKDLGLAELKKREYPKAKRSIIITANEQAEYFKVMLAALKEFDETLAEMTTHLSHGFVSLSTGKMSSRTGEVYSAVDLIGDIGKNAKKLYPKSGQDLQLAAVKYGFLKHRLGSDLIYDVEESLSLEGNSGPYLQYAHARARSILQKANDSALTIAELDIAERSLARKISEYPEIVNIATAELMPHHVANYLYELAQKFNSFYESNRVIDDSRQTTRLGLVKAYADVLQSGLGLLGIAAPERV